MDSRGGGEHGAGSGDTPGARAVVDAQIERALAPYRDLLPPEALDELRDMLEDMLTTHPVASRWLARLGPNPAVTTSGEVRTEGTAPKPVRKVEKGR